MYDDEQDVVRQALRDAGATSRAVFVVDASFPSPPVFARVPQRDDRSDPVRVADVHPA